MTAADPVWPLVVLDALHPVADDTPRPAAGVLPSAAADLPHGAPVLDNALPGIAPILDDTLPGIAPVLDDTPSPIDDLPPAAERRAMRVVS